MADLKHFKFLNAPIAASIEEVACVLLINNLEEKDLLSKNLKKPDLLNEHLKKTDFLIENLEDMEFVIKFKRAYNFIHTGKYDCTLLELLQSCSFCQCVSTETLKHFIMLCLKKNEKDTRLIIRFLKREFVPPKFFCCKVHNNGKNIVEWVNNVAFSLGIKATSNGPCSANAAACAGQLDCLVYLYEQGCEFNEDTMIAAIKGRSFECLKFLIESGCKPSKKTIKKAAQMGDIRFVEFLHVKGCRLDKDIASAAARGNHLDILKYLKNNRCKMNVTTTCAAVEGRSWECLQLLLEWNIETNYFDTFLMAAKIGDVGIFELLHKRGEWNLDEQVASTAAFAGSLKILQYCKANNGEWDYITTIAAVKGKNLDCLKYLIASGCELDHLTLRAAVRLGDMDYIKLLIDSGCEISYMAHVAAVKNRDFDCFKYLIELRRDFNSEVMKTVMRKAARVDDLRFIELLHQNGGVLDEDVSYAAAEKGNLNILIYIRDHGGEWHEEVAYAAVKARNLDCLKFLNESGVQLEPEWTWCQCTDLALCNGDVDILEYLHINGCGLGSMEPLVMTWQTNFECMVYLLQNCNWNKDIELQISTMDMLAKKGELQKIKYLREHGCSWDVESMKKLCEEKMSENENQVDTSSRYAECLLYFNNM